MESVSSPKSKVLSLEAVGFQRLAIGRSRLAFSKVILGFSAVKSDCSRSTGSIEPELRKSVGLSMTLAHITSMSDRIEIQPDVCNGRPVVRGTRIAVQSVLEFLSAGDSVEAVLEEYPDLTREDVLACLGFASGLMESGYVVEAVS